MDEFKSLWEWIIDQAKRQGLSFVLIGFIAWYTHYNFQWYKIDTDKRIQNLREAIRDCNEYSRALAEGAILKTSEQLTINNEALRDNNDLLREIRRSKHIIDK